MAGRLPVVCIFGATGVTLRSAPNIPQFETTELDCHCFADDRDLERILIALDPHVVVSIGAESDFPRLLAAPFEIRRRWLNYPDLRDLDAIGAGAFGCYLAVSLDQRTEEPLVSIFTPTYRTGDRFQRTYASVKAQLYPNWEWVIWDDSDDDGVTFEMLAAAAARDHRLRVLRGGRHSGIIGEVKYNACVASRGALLVELDHDDELMPNALRDIVAAAARFPHCGFFYSDFAEVSGAFEPLRYGDGWGHGYGGYRQETCRGTSLFVAVSPNINAKTIRGLIAAPNHVRCWRRDTYFGIGAHNRMLHVADDMELMIRTFLATEMVRIPSLCYLQYQDGTNTQRVRNQDIQRHVRFLRDKYDRRIHDRFVALGVDDWVWNDAEGRSDMDRPNPTFEQSASRIAW